MKYHVTKSEEEILFVMWNAGRPLSRADILSLSTEKNWHDNSVHILLNSMLEKGLIDSPDFVRSGKVWARVYEPTFSMKDYCIDLFSTLGWPDPFDFLEYVFSREDCSVEVIDKILEVVVSRKQELAASHT